MAIIDLGIERSAAEALIWGNVQVLLRDAVPPSVFERQDRVIRLPFGTSEFQAVLLGGCSPAMHQMTPSSCVTPFYVRKLDVTNVQLMRRAGVPVLGSSDDPLSSLDDLDLGERREYTLLVPPSLSGDSSSEFVPLLEPFSDLLEVAFAVDVVVTVQSADGYAVDPPVEASHTVRVFVALEASRQRSIVGSIRNASVRLVPRVLDVFLNTMSPIIPLVGLMRASYLDARMAPDARTARELLETATTLRSIYEGINDAVASAVFNTNDLASLFGEGAFVANAGVALTANQLRLRVQVEDEGSWFDREALLHLGDLRGLVRDAQRDAIVRTWRSFLSGADELPLPPGTSLVVRPETDFVMSLVAGALRDVLGQQAADGGPLARAAFSLRQAMDEAAPRWLLPFSGIALHNNVVDQRVVTDADRRSTWVWEWTLRFIDLCPLLASDVDVDFRLSVSVETGPLRGTPSGASESDLLLFARIDANVNDWDALRCAVPLVALAAAIVAALPAITYPALGLLFISLAQSVLSMLDATPETVQLGRDIESAIREQVTSLLASVFPDAGAGVSVGVVGDGGGLSAHVRIQNVLGVLASKPEAAEVLQLLTPLSLPNTFDQLGVGIRMVNDALQIGVALPSKDFTRTRLEELLTIERSENEAWTNRHTFGINAVNKFAWAVDGCRLIDESTGRSTVERARYAFRIDHRTMLLPWSLRVFSVDVISPAELRTGLSTRYALDHEGRVPSAVPRGPLTAAAPATVLWPVTALRVTLDAPTPLAVRLATGRAGRQTLVIAVATNGGRLLLRMARPFSNLDELLPFVIDPAAHRDQIDALQERCLLGQSIPGATTAARGGGGLGPLPAGLGDIASLLLAAFGPMPRFGDGDVRELLGLRLPHEIINPATVYEAEAGVALGVDAFRIERGSMGVLHDARDIAGELLRTVRD